jgi:hypothetical protein
VRIDQARKFFSARLKILIRECGEPVQAEILDSKGGEDCALEHSVGEGGEGDLFLAGEVTRKATCESVSSTCGIENFIQRDGWSRKSSLFSG